ncbi:MAG: nitroreductase family deazaflavin-dependent oxidoreductase [Anaerolineae bacterium]|nr:nitroreductase family deazaflavin-dependent oxidoreductase [Anaerolineae bacterium]
MTVPPTPVQPPKMNFLFKLSLKPQIFLLRRNMMGSAGNFLMVITTTGRKSGKQFSTPIGYLRDGETIYAFNLGGQSNWYKNLLVNPLVKLEIKGKAYAMRGEKISDTAEAERVLGLYQQQQASTAQRFFGLAPDATGAERLKVLDHVTLIRFSPA